MPDTNQPSAEASPSKRKPSQANERGSSALLETSDQPMPRYDVHCIMQGKGGVGKSFVASLLTQWHQTNNRPVMAFDTDPLNATLRDFPGLAATPITLLDEDQINIEAVDRLIEEIATKPSAAVIDNGSASFAPMGRYLVSHGIAELLAQHNRRLVLHTLVIGGQPAVDTVRGLLALLGQFPKSVPVVVWVNEYAEKFQVDGYAFEETRAYQDNVLRIAGIVHLPSIDPRSFGRDLSAMLAKRMTFAEAIESPEFMLVSKSRLFRIRQAVFDQLDTVLEAL
jgi:hypothetical protein